MRWLPLMLLSACLCFGQANRYVDNALVGSSANDGLAWASAWTNFSSIGWNGLATGSNTIYFSGGTTGKIYNEYMYIKHTSSNGLNRLTLRCGQDAGHTGALLFLRGIQLGDESAAKANNVTIDGSLNGAINWTLAKTNAGSAIYHRYAGTFSNQYLYLDITTATNEDGQTHCIQLGNSADGTEVAYCRIHDSQNKGIREGSSSPTGYGRLLVHHNTFYGNADDDIVAAGGVDFYNNSCDGTGSDNTLHPDGIQGVTGYWRIYNNVFHDHTQEIFIETTSETMQDVLIYNNVFYEADSGSWSPAIILKAKLPVTANHVWTNIVIANNTMVGMKTTALRLQAVTGITLNILASKICNNIWVTNVNNTGMNDGGEGTVTWADSEVQWRNNVFYDPQTVNYLGTGYSVAALEAAHTNAVLNLTNAPAFYNQLTRDFRPVAGSIVIGAGAVLTEFTTDASGETRGPTWDIGAFEYRPIITHNIGTLRIGTLRNP